MEADGFQLVKSKKTAKRRDRRDFKPREHSQNDEKRSGVSKESIVTRILQYRSEIEASSYYGNLKDALFRSGLIIEVGTPPPESPTDQDFTPIASLVTYGLGHIASCLIAQYQLALCLVFRDTFKKHIGTCLVYDPVFTELEKDVLKELGFNVIQENEEGARIADKPTLFFMPHCGKPLYNNLLWANWSPELLQNVNLIGNSFQCIVDSTPSRFLKQEASLIEKIQPHASEWTIENTFKHSDIFNNTSVHKFTNSRLHSVPDSFWNAMPKPTYVHNVEIIVRSDNGAK